MSLSTRISALAQATGADIKAHRLATGNLINLTTTEKTSLVAALNEISLAVSDLGDIGARIIDDSASAADKAYSSDHIEALFANLKSQILDGVDEAYDTLEEIATYLANNESVRDSLNTAIAEKVSYTEEQTLQEAQQAQARVNIGIDVGFNLGEVYAGAKIASIPVAFKSLFTYFARGELIKIAETGSGDWKLANTGGTAAPDFSNLFYANKNYVFANNADDQLGSLTYKLSKSLSKFDDIYVSEIDFESRAEIVGFQYIGGKYILTAQLYRQDPDLGYELPNGSRIFTCDIDTLDFWESAYVAPHLIYTYPVLRNSKISIFVQPRSDKFYFLEQNEAGTWEKTDIDVSPAGSFPTGTFTGAVNNSLLVFVGKGGLAKAPLDFSTVTDVPWTLEMNGHSTNFLTAVVRNNHFYVISEEMSGFNTVKYHIHRTDDFLTFTHVQSIDVAGLGIGGASSTVDAGDRISVTLSGNYSLLSADATAWTLSYAAVF